ncbi:hypothetical protein JCM5350_003604 [Sporobolomyces pararoseus]
MLPNETLLDIFSHLPRDNRRAGTLRTEGKALSLVCRSWFPAGQALLWSSIRISNSEVQSFTEHFNRYPHLAKLVQTLKINFNSGATMDDMDPRAFARLPHLLSLCVKLREFVAIGGMGRHLQPVLATIAHFENLHTVELIYAGQVDWTNEVARTFDRGFSKLSKFTFDGYILNLLNNNTGRPVSQRHKLPVKELSMWWQNGEVGWELDRLAERLLSHFDTTTLLDVYLRGSAVTSDGFNWLSTCSNLHKLELVLLQNQAYGLSRYLKVLPRFAALETFKIDMRFEEDYWDDFLPSPAPLSEFLASFPPSLRTFEAKKFLFTDLGSIPSRQLSTTAPGPLPARRFLAASTSDPRGGGEVVPLEIWADESGGTICWYRNVKENGGDE